MIKAAAGGGGRGIRRVDEPNGIAAAFTSATAEAAQAFGDGTLLMERLIAPARHVEVQVIADGQGAAWALGLRDCSYQRRNQKVIEESSSPALTAEQEAEIMEAARRLVLRAGYRNAATVEFLYEPATGRFSFMEVNARLQVEHPVTEMVTGVDLVKLQLHVAAGGRLEGEPPPPVGHAIEARLERRGPVARIRPRTGTDRAAAAADRPRGARRHRRRRGRRDPRRVRLDDRQDHRVGARSLRGAGPPAARARRGDGRHRGRHHQPGVPARAARP